MAETALYNFNIIDIIILVILLSFGVYGLIRGLLKQVMGFVSTIAAIVIAYFLCSVLANMLINSGLGNSILNAVKGLIGESWDKEAAVSEISNFIAEQNLPNFIAQAIINAVEALNQATVNFAEVASSTITRYILVALSFIIIFIISKILLFVIIKILALIINKTPIVIVDKLTGFLLGGVKGLIFCYLALFILNLLSLSSAEGAANLLSGSRLAQFLMRYNPFTYLLGLLFN